MFVLKRAVGVSPDPEREDALAGRTYTIDAFTKLDDIPKSELEQLAPEHFVMVDDVTEPDQMYMAVRVADPSVLPEEWRTNPDTLAHDKRQKKNTEAETKQRDKARKARRAEKAKEYEERG